MFDWLIVLFSPVENPGLVQSLVVLFLAIGGGVFVGRVKLGKVSLGVAAVMFVGICAGISASGSISRSSESSPVGFSVSGRLRFSASL